MFSILNTELLTSELLPRFFKHSKIDSFVRQVRTASYAVKHLRLSEDEEVRGPQQL